MAITVTLYTLSKRENSTKRPTGGGTSFSCTLIDETSLYEPTFKLSIPSNPIGKNYCYVPDFNRYYFISGITSKQGFWFISCVCDVLASFKHEIGPQSHYVLRAASEYDEYISDSHYGAKIREYCSAPVSQTGSLYWGTGHTYIVGITSLAHEEANQTGSVTYYQMDDKFLNNFVKYLMQELPDYCNITSAPYDDPGVQEALINPIQYIVSCIGVPVPFPETSVRPGSIRFGYYYWVPSITHGNFREIPMGYTETEGNVINLPKHPQASTRGKYMNAAPFNSYVFHCGPWGDIPLDPADYVDATNLRYKITYELCTGMGRLVVGPAIDGTDNIHNITFCGQTQVGAPLQISQAIIDPLTSELAWETGMNNVIATGISGGVGLNTPSNLLRAQNVLQETYVDAIKNRYPTCNSKGSPGSFFNFFDQTYGTYLLHKYYMVVDENIEEIGRPLCKVKQLNTLSGFILCEGADAAITGTQEEAIKINEYLNTGFFYE